MQKRAGSNVQFFAFVRLLLFSAWFYTANCQAAADNYLPIIDGAEWIMDFNAVSPTGEQIKATAHRTIGPKVEREGKTYWRSHTWVEGTKSFQMDYTKLVRKNSEGFYSIYENDPNAKESRDIKLPLKVGASWDTIVGAATITYTVIAKESVVIGNKTYSDCYHIQAKSKTNDYTEDLWESPSMGSVKSEIQIGKGKASLVLREYKESPKKP